MEIYVLRHGDADAERALTETGRQKLRRVLQRAKSADSQPSLILTSPYRRARETAQIAGEVLGCGKSSKVKPWCPGPVPKTSGRRSVPSARSVRCCWPVTSRC